MSLVDSINHYRTTTHAKIILAGEHAVLRGSSALVLPLLNRTFLLNYSQHEKTLTAECKGLYSEIVLFSFWNTLNKGLQLINRSQRELTGIFNLENNIQIAAGIGFSAALCVAIASWFKWKKWIPADNVFEFARTLEHIFHGKSSGIDIIGAMSETIMLFRIGQSVVEIKPSWQPKLYLTFLNTKSITALCVNKVTQLWKHDPKTAELLDQKMQESVDNAQLALQMPTRDGLILLQKAINEAQTCFLNWNLMTHEMKAHINFLQQEGAIAAKPTGAGLGGYILSLWDKDPCLKTLNKYSPISIRV